MGNRSGVFCFVDKRLDSIAKLKFSSLLEGYFVSSVTGFLLGKHSLMNTKKDLWRAICRQPLRIMGYVFTAFSSLFTLVTALNFFVPGVKLEGFWVMICLLALSLVYVLKQVCKPSKVEIKMTNFSTKLEVLFGDIFQQEGIRVIAVNEFFDSKLGKPVSENSVHGVFIKRCFGGHPEPFDKQVEEELKSVEYSVAERVEGKTKRYPLGTTALIKADQDLYLTFAFSKTDEITCKAHTDVTMMWASLHDLWRRARVESNGRALNIPLVGSGLSGIGLPTRDLLNLIILSVITETKANQITQRIRIVLHKDRFEDVDLREIKKYWEE